MTIVGGFIFVGSQAWEWYHFIIGDSGAIETSHQEILHVYNAEGERLSFGQLVHGMEEGHASNHGETFSKAEVLTSLESNKEYYLKEPGKEGEAFTHQESIAFLESGCSSRSKHDTKRIRKKAVREFLLLYHRVSWFSCFLG